MAVADPLFYGQIALENGFITEAQLDDALAHQAVLKGRGVNRMLGAILVDRKLITAAQSLEIAENQKFLRIKREDVKFGQLALRQGVLDPGSFKRMLAKQDQAFAAGERPAPRIADLLVDEGLLSHPQRQALWKALGKGPVDAGVGEAAGARSRGYVNKPMVGGAVAGSRKAAARVITAAPPSHAGRNAMTIGIVIAGFILVGGSAKFLLDSFSPGEDPKAAGNSGGGGAAQTPAPGPAAGEDPALTAHRDGLRDKAREYRQKAEDAYSRREFAESKQHYDRAEALQRELLDALPYADPQRGGVQAELDSIRQAAETASAMLTAAPPAVTPPVAPPPLVAPPPVMPPTAGPPQDPYPPVTPPDPGLEPPVTPSTPSARTVDEAFLASDWVKAQELLTELLKSEDTSVNRLKLAEACLYEAADAWGPAMAGYRKARLEGDSDEAQKVARRHLTPIMNGPVKRAREQADALLKKFPSDLSGRILRGFCGLMSTENYTISSSAESLRKIDQAAKPKDPDEMRYCEMIKTFLARFTYECKNCSGQGKIKWKCADCGGTGIVKLFPSGRRKCTNCGGKGGGIADCKPCGATGAISAAEGPAK